MKKLIPSLIFLVLIFSVIFYIFNDYTPDSAGLSPNNSKGSQNNSTGRMVIQAQKEAVGPIRTLDNGTVLGGRPVMPAQYRITEPAGVQVREVVDNLVVPWDMEFTRDGKRLYFTERPGRVQFVEFYGEKATLHLWMNREDSTLNWGEGGLMGIALHPDFGTGEKDNEGKSLNWIYLSETYGSITSPGNRILRIRKIEGSAGAEIEREILIDNIPAASFHNGSRLAFGPDGMLYATTGDAGEPELAQNLNSWAGKILRMTREGRPAPGNPFSGQGAKSYVYSYGHRNPQGLAWHPETGDLYISEHGPSGEFGLQGNDEINLIHKGENYGWPQAVGAPDLKGLTDPLLLFSDPHLPPAGMTFYTGDKLKDWEGDLFAGSLAAELLLKADINYKNEEPVVTDIQRFFEIMPFRGTYGRIRAIATSPDGYLYFATSNRDGRGNPAPDDDRIMRISPSP